MKPRAAEVNRALRSLYKRAWPAYRRLQTLRDGFSNPLFLKVQQSYCEAPTRLLIVGQQTDTWYDNLSVLRKTDPVKCLMQLYERFNLSRTEPTRRNSPFWRACFKVHAALNGPHDQYDFAWTNIIKVDQRRRRVALGVEDDLSSEQLVGAEINALRPEAVLFFTGPSYEQRLLDAFPGAEAKKISSLIRDGSRKFDILACRKRAFELTTQDIYSERVDRMCWSTRSRFSPDAC